MAIKRGLQTCEATMTNCGEAGKSMTYEEAATYIRCSDVEVSVLAFPLHHLPFFVALFRMRSCYQTLSAVVVCWVFIMSVGLWLMHIPSAIIAVQ
jgi:hypothetical protein